MVLGDEPCLHDLLEVFIDVAPAGIVYRRLTLGDKVVRGPVLFPYRCTALPRNGL